MTTEFKDSTVMFCVVIIASGLISGCADSRIYTKQQYALQVNRGAGEQGEAGVGIVRVRRFQISEGFSGIGLVYRTSDVNYESDFYNEFMVSPVSIITEQSRRWLNESGVFAGVVDTSSGVKAGYVLEGNVVGLYGDYRDKTSPEAVLEIEFTLIAAKALDNPIVFHQAYAATQAVVPANAAALVKGFNACLAEILGSLEADLRKVVK
jgi:cholesterol transport system auxiliary component